MAESSALETARGCEVECVATGAEAFGDAPQAFGQRISESDGYAAERILGRQRRAGRLFEAVVHDGSFRRRHYGESTNPHA